MALLFCKSCGAKAQEGARFCRDCGEPVFRVFRPRTEALAGRTATIALPGVCGPRARKSVGAALTLAVLFGPLGLVYSSVSGALYMAMAWCFLVLATCGDWIAGDLVPILIVWPISMVWAALAVRSYNADLR